MALTPTQTPTPSVDEMKQTIKDQLAKTFTKTNYQFTKLPDNYNFEANGFMLNQHAKAIKGIFNGSVGRHISFRNSGSATLNRIKSGNPCKGHDILDKTLKLKDGGYTYTVKNWNDADYNKYIGFVGYPATNCSDGTTLGGFWAYIGGAKTKVALDNLASADVNTFYTGDYDLHDLIDNGARLLSGTGETAMLNNINSKMLPPNNTINEIDNARRTKMQIAPSLTQSEYALVRHGAQTNYVSFLLSGTEEITIGSDDTVLYNEEGVTNISDQVMMFNSEGAFLLDSVETAYYYYNKYKLLDQVSFYYFFQYLRKKATDDKNDALLAILSTYSQRLNVLLQGAGAQDF